MTLPVVEVLGAPSYGPAGPFEGDVYHTPEGVDMSLAAAIAMARWQAGPGNTSGGSYHGIVGFDETVSDDMDEPDGWTMVASVSWDLAAGGLSSARDHIWRPDRYPQIAATLSPIAYYDPNRFMRQIALSGKASQYAMQGYPRGLVIRLAEWIIEDERNFRYDALLTAHRMWQTNRTDPGPLELVEDGGLLITAYHELVSAPDVPIEPPPRFDDVPRSHPQYEDIEWAARNGVTKGIDSDSFGPDLPATRAQIVTFLRRYHDGQATFSLMGATKPVGPEDPESVTPDEDELRALMPSTDEIRELRRGSPE